MATKPKEQSEKQNLLPLINDGEIVVIESIELIKDETKPPSRHTEASLLADMEGAGKFLADDPEFRKILNETSGLGTAATRSGIIEKLINVGYIERIKDGKNEYLVATEKGHRFIDWLENIMPEAVDVALTAKWEAELTLISKTGNIAAFKEKIKTFMTTFIANAKSNKPISTTTKDDNMSENTNSAPSDKQLNFAKLIASKAGIRLPDEVMVDRAACSKFIDENSSKALAPSPKQLTFANSIASRKKVTIPEDALNNGKLLSEWIDKNKD